MIDTQLQKEWNYLFTGFLMSYLTIYDIKNWANCQLSHDNNHATVIEISLADNSNIIVSELKKEYSENKILIVDIGQEYLSLFKKIYTKNLLPWIDIGKEICKLYNNHFFIPSNETEADFLFRLNDYYGLLSDNLSGNMKMPEELHKFLSAYDEDIKLFKDFSFNIKGVAAALLT